MESIRRIYLWDGYPRIRMTLAVGLTAAAVALGFAASWTLEGMLRFGQLGLAAIAFSTVLAPPAHRKSFVLAAPFALGALGAFGYVAGVTAFGIEALVFMVLRRLGLPWADTRRIRRLALVVAAGIGFACAYLAVRELA